MIPEARDQDHQDQDEKVAVKCSIETTRVAIAIAFHALHLERLFQIWIARKLSGLDLTNIKHYKL